MPENYDEQDYKYNHVQSCCKSAENSVFYIRKRSEDSSDRCEGEYVFAIS